jgi:transcriptional regulator with XRE-family HTH domain
VPGLRREELATLAALSVDYYMRLEQGRDHRPSEQVLECLARALQLDDDATAHLYGLARAALAATQHHSARLESVAPDLRALLGSWTTIPALVHGRRLDVLAATRLARELSPMSEPGTNILRSIFLNPEARERCGDLEHACAACVAYMRANVAGHLDDPDLTDLVGELSLKSDEFRQLWARHDVQQGLSGDQIIVHPVAGVIHLHNHTFAVEGANGQTLLVGHPTPGSPDAQALALLAAQAADLDTPSPEPQTHHPIADNSDHASGYRSGEIGGFPKAV